MSGNDPGFDRGALCEALRTINRVRGRERGDPARTAGLLSALERLLAAERSSGRPREPGGGGALAELDAILRGAGVEEGAASLRDYIEPILERLIDALLEGPARRLAAYGSLRPGEENHGQVARLVGRWLEGTVEGTLHERGWGATHGYPGLVWRPGGPRVRVEVFESPALVEHWDRLDAFEGSAYERILVPVDMSCGVRVCNLYAVREIGGAPRPPGARSKQTPGRGPTAS